MGTRLYSYKAATAEGGIVRGSTLASSSQDLYQQLRMQNIFLISSRVKTSLFKAKMKVSTQELLDFCLHMQFMEKAGVPLLDGLRDAQKASPALKPILADMIVQIKGGKMLSEAMEAHRNVFPDIFQPIIYLSEQSGQLGQGFKTLYEHLSWTEQNKRQLAKGLQYPAIVFALICGVIWLMSTVVVPQMFDLIKMSGMQVPYYSTLLLHANQGLVLWAPRLIMIFFMTVSVALGLRFLSHQQKLYQDRLILQLPILGRLFRKRDVSVFLHFFHVCLTSHVDLLECIAYGGRAVRNCYVRAQLARCATSVREGAILSAAMGQAGIFDASTLRMVQIGEVTGQLPALLAVIESYQVRDLKREIEKLLTFLQPALLGIIGLMLIWIVLGIFYPLYEQLLMIEG